MAENSKIEWTDHTFNPWIGCTKVSPGCDHCYAEAWDRRFAVSGHAMRWGDKALRTRTSAANWRLPLKWDKQSEADGVRRKVFCASLADVFDNAVPPEWRAALFALIAGTPHLDWLLLTKRIGNVAKMIEAPGMQKCGLPPNVWLGATVVDQEEADRDIPKLLAVPARVRFLSIEPMLGPIDLDAALWRYEGPMHIRREALHWVICGGESGAGARPISPDWARRLRDQCKAAGVAFLFKQWGEWLPMLGQAEGVSVGKKATTPDGWIVGWAGKKSAGRSLDGAHHDQFPNAI